MHQMHGNIFQAQKQTYTFLEIFVCPDRYKGPQNAPATVLSLFWIDVSALVMSQWLYSREAISKF